MANQRVADRAYHFFGMRSGLPRGNLTNMKKLLLPAFAAAALATGCMTHGDVGVGYSYGYASPSPDMYVVGDGVNVVAYADYPTFYSDNYYWMYNGGVWYRSGYYGGGWAASYDVPYRVRSIRAPHTYARFQPGNGWTRARSPAYQGGGASVRDQRGYNGGYNGGTSGRTYTPPNGAVRDHRSGGGYSPPASSPPARDHRAAPPASYGPPPARDNRGASPSYGRGSPGVDRGRAPGGSTRNHRR